MKKWLTWLGDSNDKPSIEELNLLCGGWGCCCCCGCKLYGGFLGTCIVGVLRCDASLWTKCSKPSGGTVDMMAGEMVRLSVSEDTLDETIVGLAERFRVFEFIPTVKESVFAVEVMTAWGAAFPYELVQLIESREAVLFDGLLAPFGKFDGVKTIVWLTFGTGALEILPATNCVGKTELATLLLKGIYYQIKC